MDYQNLTYELDGEHVIITLNRPERRNCLSAEVLKELEHAMRNTVNDVSGIVLASTGPVFSSGHDLAEMRGMSEEGLRDLFSVCTNTMLAMAEIPQVVVAQVQGLATAAGAQLVASADLIVAAEDAGFATPGGKGGLFCHTPMVAVARPIGRKRAMELALTGDVIDAKTALEWGLVNRVVPAAELEDATRDLLSRATRGSRYSKGIGKQTLYKQMDMDVAGAYEHSVDVMARSAAVGDGAEWPNAFLDKRPPEWSHTH